MHTTRCAFPGRGVSCARHVHAVARAEIGENERHAHCSVGRRLRRPSFSQGEPIMIRSPLLPVVFALAVPLSAMSCDGDPVSTTEFPLCDPHTTRLVGTID